MFLFNEEFVISKIVVALLVPNGKGAPIHKNRHAHGLAFNFNCESTYSFESGEVLTCKSGDCIYLPMGSSYTVESRVEGDSEAGVYAINFLTLSQQDGFLPLLMHVRGREEMQSLFSRAAHAWRKKSAGFREECFGDLYKIVKILKKESSGYSSQKRTEELIRPALNYIDENYTAENIPLSLLAELCGVSESYLRRLFQLAFSVSPAVYMRNMRIKYAKELLLSNEYSVTDVAMLSGFNDVAYFSREFKKATGVSPSDYE